MRLVELWMHIRLSELDTIGTLFVWKRGCVLCRVLSTTDNGLLCNTSCYVKLLYDLGLLPWQQLLL